MADNVKLSGIACPLQVSSKIGLSVGMLACMYMHTDLVSPCHHLCRDLMHKSAVKGKHLMDHEPVQKAHALPQYNRLYKPAGLLVLKNGCLQGRARQKHPLLSALIS